ncbi:MAG: hypothetical protein FWG70_08485 [Oscillospiraceae bacterium]|nr:hypothetical protein [Oscillospiraceae bacterium]
MKKHTNKGRGFLTNGVLLAGTTILLIVYISTNYLWSIGTIVVTALAGVMSGFQFWVYFYFINKNS